MHWKLALLGILSLVLWASPGQGALQCRDIFSNKNQHGFENPIREIWLNFARKAGANSDFKYIADLVLKDFSPQQRAELIQLAKEHRQKIYQRLVDAGFSHQKALKLAQTAYARRILEYLFADKVQIKNIDEAYFGKPLELQNSYETTVLNFHGLKRMFAALESSWTHLVKRMIFYKNGSLLKASDIFFVAGGRFRENYYWDSFFGSYGLLKTGRVDLVIRQMNKFINDINQYGLIPNGGRTYYLTRSQPPVISMMARLIHDHTRDFSKAERNEVDQWLQNDVLKALEKDYSEFWMKERLDPETGLNFYSDKLDKPRPEAHSKDNSGSLARSERDVRGEAESGQDFSNVFNGQASRTLSVKLNALLFAYEQNLAWLYSMKADVQKSSHYQELARQRKDRINQYLRDKDGLYRNYHLDTKTQNEGISGEIFALMYVKALSPKEAAQLVPLALELLEKPGGIAASTYFQSKKQWDGKYGWAPFQIMAVQGLLNYGYEAHAQRLMTKWLQTNLNIFESTGQFYEKVDVLTSQLPIFDNSKYQNQVGFLWTNSSIVWMLHQLGYRFNHK